MAIVKGDTHNHWGVVSRTDSRYKNYTQDFYICDLKYIQFKEVI